MPEGGFDAGGDEILDFRSQGGRGQRNRNFAFGDSDFAHQVKVDDAVLDGGDENLLERGFYLFFGDHLFSFFEHHLEILCY